MQATRILRQMEAHLSKPTNQKRHQSKSVRFMGIGCDVSVSISLSIIGKTISQTHKVTKHTHRHSGCQSNQSDRGKVGWLDGGRTIQLSNLCRPRSHYTFTLALKNISLMYCILALRSLKKLTIRHQLVFAFKHVSIRREF